VPRSGPHERGRHISHQGSRNAPQTSFFKKTLIVISYATACAIVALAMAYSPVSAGNILAKIIALSVHPISASNISNRVHKADRLSSCHSRSGGGRSRRRWLSLPIGKMHKKPINLVELIRHHDAISARCQERMSRFSHQDFIRASALSPSRRVSHF
jgi:hypothetical protein